MPDLHQSRDAELEALLASEIGDRKKAVAAEILRRRQEAKVQKWSGAMFSLLVFSGPYWPAYLPSSSGSAEGSQQRSDFSQCRLSALGRCCR